VRSRNVARRNKTGSAKNMLFLVVKKNVGAESGQNRRFVMSADEMGFISRCSPSSKRVNNASMSWSVSGCHDGDANAALTSSRTLANL